MLNIHWSAPEGYKFPFSTRKLSGKLIKHFLSAKHLDLYNEWVVLSDVEKGLFCKYCLLFTIWNEGGFKKNVPLKSLVTVPLTNFKNLTGSKNELELHSNHLYHKNAIDAGKLFLKGIDNPSIQVENQLNVQTLQQKEIYKQRLLSIIKTIIFIGQNNISLRGHRYDGSLLSSAKGNSEGIFRSLLRFRIDAGDTILNDHLKNCPENASYISKTT